MFWGFPGVLNLYEDYPFWATFLRELGFAVQLSPQSSKAIYEMGMETTPSESECYPAKLSHGHVEWLIAHGVTRIFYPCVYYERKEDEGAQNHFNCPMVMSYPENLKNNIEELWKGTVKMYSPFVAFTDEKTITERLKKVMAEEFGVPEQETASAAAKAWAEAAARQGGHPPEGRTGAGVGECRPRSPRHRAGGPALPL